MHVCMYKIDKKAECKYFVGMMPLHWPTILFKYVILLLNGALKGNAMSTEHVRNQNIYDNIKANNACLILTKVRSTDGFAFSKYFAI